MQTVSEAQESSILPFATLPVSSHSPSGRSRLPGFQLSPCQKLSLLIDCFKSASKLIWHL